MTVAITGLDLTESDLRQAARQTDDANAARRMLPIAFLLEGWSREAAAEACGMDRQTLCDWVQRYNVSGLDGTIGPAATARCPGCRKNSRPRLQNGLKRALILSGMA